MPIHEATGFWYPEDAKESVGAPSGVCHAILWHGRHAPFEAMEIISALGISEDELLERIREGALLALPVNPDEILFPAWQFDGHKPGRLLAGLHEILAVAPTDPWGVADLLTHRQPTFDERIPISALRGGADRGRRRISSASALLRALDLIRAAYL